MNLKPVKENYLAAGGRMTVFSESARKAGRGDDADALELAACACRECADYAPEAPAAADLQETDGLPPAVCLLCGKEGKRVGLGWACQNHGCVRRGAAMSRGQFEGRDGDAPDASGSTETRGAWNTPS